MAISQVIADLAGVLDATRQELGAVSEQIAEMEHKRRTVVAAPPHTDDIVAAFQRGLRATAGEFTRQLTSHLTETYVTATNAAEAAGRVPLVLTIEEHKPDAQTLMLRSLRSDAPVLNMAALAFFLREPIEAQLPALVDRLCPEARKGMKGDNRQAALESIEAEIARLNEERERLSADLGAARAAVRA